LPLLSSVRSADPRSHCAVSRVSNISKEPRCPPTGSDGNHQEAAMAPKPRRAPQETPDSLPKRDGGTDVMPDDRSQRILPDSPPPMDEQSIERAENPRGKR